MPKKIIKIEVQLTTANTDQMEKRWDKKERTHYQYSPSQKHQTICMIQDSILYTPKKNKTKVTPLYMGVVFDKFLVDILF